MYNKYKYIILGALLSIHSNIYANEVGILGGTNVTKDKIRTGDFHTDDIPLVISGAIDYLMGVAATISLIFIIVGAYKIALGTLEGDKSKGKETVYYALAGFVLSSCSWLIIKFVFDNFS